MSTTAVKASLIPSSSNLNLEDQPSGMKKAVWILRPIHSFLRYPAEGLAVLSMVMLDVKLYNPPGSQAETIKLCSLRSLKSCQMEQLEWLWSGRITFVLFPDTGNHPVPQNYLFSSHLNNTHCFFIGCNKSFRQTGGCTNYNKINLLNRNPDISMIPL